jgi:hypothetical protein
VGTLPGMTQPTFSTAPPSTKSAPRYSLRSIHRDHPTPPSTSENGTTGHKRAADAAADDRRVRAKLQVPLPPPASSLNAFARLRGRLELFPVSLPLPSFLKNVMAFQPLVFLWPWGC